MVCRDVPRPPREPAHSGNLNFHLYGSQNSKGWTEGTTGHRVPFCHCGEGRDTKLRSPSSPAVLCQYAGHKPALDPGAALTDVSVLVLEAQTKNVSDQKPLYSHSMSQ